MKKVAYLLFCLFVSNSSFAQKADFGFANHCLNNLIYFEDHSKIPSSDSIVSWSWAFGDGSISTDKNPIHAYAEPGSFDVHLTVYTSSEKNFDTTKTIQITTPPFAFFNPEQFCGGKVAFYDNTFAKANSVKMWMWDFGDGDYSTEQNPFHQFSATEHQDVHLKVMDQNGCWDSISQSVTILGLPEAGFSVDNIISNNPAVIQINSINGKDSVFYLFNDQIFKGAQLAIPHQNETIELTQKVKDESGCQDSITKNIHASKSFLLVAPTEIRVEEKKQSVFTIESDSNTIVKLIITNKFGHVVHETANNSWDGYILNNKASVGIYSYAIEFKTQDGIELTQKGQFKLIY